MARLLVIDDDSDTRLLLEMFLRSSSHVRFFAQNGTEAKEILRNDTIDYVFCDTNMNNEYGPRLMKQIQSCCHHQEYVLIGMNSLMPHPDKRNRMNYHDTDEVRAWMAIDAVKVVNQSYLHDQRNIDSLIAKYPTDFSRLTTKSSIPCYCIAATGKGFVENLAQTRG